MKKKYTLHTNDFLYMKLYDMKNDIIKYKYKTKKHFDTIRNYNKLLRKLKTIDKIFTNVDNLFDDFDYYYAFKNKKV
jgi:hypothetical protein